MAASGAMPSWTNSIVPPIVIAHPRKDAGISYKYKYKFKYKYKYNIPKKKYK